MARSQKPNEIGGVHADARNACAPLHDPSAERDACGVGFIANVRGIASHAIVEAGLTALERLEHRAATGAEENTGDGAGVLIQLPDRLFQRECALGRIEDPETKKPLASLPSAGGYAVGLFFGSQQPEATALARLIFAMVLRQEGLKLLGWRRVPTDNRRLGATAKSVEPTMDHVFVAPALEGLDEATFERKLYVARKRFQATIKSTGIDDRRYFHVPSLSSKTLAYKGMLTPDQVRDYFSDLEDPRTESALAMFHSRFSTNTFPSWELAHPYRQIAHNGEINTLRGNVNWMRAREALLASPELGADIEKILPVVHEGLSDSACLDSVLELLVRAGRSLPHAVMMMLPEAWEHNESITPELRAFYQYHACLIEPWDGPACVCFTDGKCVGAVLDRNGLRPGRYWVTSDDLVILASESGVADVPAERVVEKGRLMPGHMFLIDLEQGRVVPDAEIKRRVATARPYAEWLKDNLVALDSLPRGPEVPKLAGEELERALAAFGTTEEELRLLVAPMAARGEEPTGSMGNDAALAVLSTRARPLSDYFKQLFAQVTNPPLDAIREKLVTSMATAIGPEGNLLEARPESARLVLCKTPFLDNEEMSRFKRIAELFSPEPSAADSPFGVTVLDMTFPAVDGEEGLEPALVALFAKADNAIANGSKVLVLSDRSVNAARAPIPALLAVAGLHNHLVRERKRTRVTMIVETGWVREVHQAALLIGYGASAINPYLTLDALPTLAARGLASADLSDEDLTRKYLAAIEKGVVKVMSKMGISTIASYRGAQIFEAIGLSKELVDRYFTLTPSRIGGIGARDVARDTLSHHTQAFAPRPVRLPVAGEYQWRKDGELHLFNPDTIYLLQHATRSGRRDLYASYARAVNDQSERHGTLRSLLRVNFEGSTPVPLDEVEPVEAILPRFATGAMSFGSISAEAHETLAIAMNRIGGKSNSGEGGEDRRRFVPDDNGDSRRSAIKQVASARFGVTSEYLVDADELQIKMAQGAKPGEGGQLPGAKVYPWIAAVRHSTPGVALISPPPHHDIYSIEDLAELIFDLRSANPRARISVKLVAEVGVGTVAAGVVKAKSDVVLVSGHDGGTGASPLTSIKHAGAPWELGLAEAQQVLVKNRLRDRVVLQVDGQMKTGRDVAIAALLGAEEFGFATAPLVVMGCVMMRVCHLDTCPVGIATQSPDLRKRFTGQADHVVSYFRFVAEELRQIMAELGFRTLDEMVGRVDLLESVPATGNAGKVDLSAVLDAGHLQLGEPIASAPARRRTGGTLPSSPPSSRSLSLIERMATLAAPALAAGAMVRERLVVSNRDRAVGTRLGSDVTRRRGAEGLPDDTITFELEGSAGQSLGAFLPRGITLICEGDANDYVGKGLSGGKVAVRPPRGARFVAERNVIAGNVALYGATSGKAFFRGRVGERFAVRNSGATAVAEGCGDHGCEYMTGGRVVILGPAGRNFAAGMSGGLAYVLDEDGRFASRHNPEMVALRALDDDDEAWLRATVEEHAALTDSSLARALLDDFTGARARFVKVVPLEYERVLAASREAAARAASAVAAE
ncbi:MAG: glutamate synthase large subunit [Polyangiaceae bacterium]|nr:glutamate synthase large subunit [Polyangiaceae bacterium]